MASHGKHRFLNIFVNVIYNLDSTINKVEDTDPPHWPRITNASQAGINVSGTIPNYLLDFMDTSYVCGNTQGTITRLYGESSFDSLQLIGDFVVVNVLESRVIQDYAVFNYINIAKTCMDMINDTPTGLHTLYGHDSIYHYSNNNSRIQCYQIIIRNISSAYGGLGMNSGMKKNVLQECSIKMGDRYYPISGVGTVQNVGSDDISTNPTGIVPHEISHSLFGGNNFHTSGGNHRGSTESMPWMNIQGGYGLMGAAHSGLVSCNGYERWRMHWKHAGSPYYISAHNISNNMYVNSDIKKEDGTKWFLLRDFVTYGDAVRIKMPYKDSTITPNQYIWLEFHNVGNNNKLDFLQYSNSDSCLYSGTPGIYAYYQIGRDVLESENRYDIWDIVNRDNLRIISNEGYWDYTRHIMERDTSFDCTQWNWVPDYYTPDYSNAFCGYNDQEKFIVPEDYDTDLGSIFDDPDDIQERVMSNKIAQGDTVKHSLSFLGDSLDAFSSHRKINMGTNPSTCNAKTYYSYNTSTSFPMRLAFNKNSQYNNATTYLTGLSIEMIPRPDSVSYLVKIRWDDYDIVDDTRWTGKIALKGTERVNLTRGHDITLAQNRTPAQQIRDSVSGYFAAPTKLTCEAGSHFTQQPHSTLLLTEKSRFVLDSAATYHLGDSAQILVQGASTFTISKGADFTGGIASEIVVDSLSTLYVYDTARLRREARLIVRPGGKLIVNGGTLTSACEGEMWQGIIVEGNPSLPQYAQRQGSVILNNATVENARNAISTRGADTNAVYEHTGGIVQATNTLFRNNRRAAEFLEYENHSGSNVTDNTSRFTRCTFIVDDDNLFASNGTSFLEHVSMWRVRGVKFNGCDFRNETTGTSVRGTGIRSIEAGFTAKRVCPQLSNSDPCGCYNSGSDTVRRCSFTGFSEAVHAANTLGAYDITLDNCDFAYNTAGVSLYAADNARVSFCDFALGDSLSVLGLQLSRSSGFIVEGNTFHKHSKHYPYPTGILCDSTGTAENIIRLNSFSGLYTACNAVGNNSAIPMVGLSGLQYQCNSYNGNTYDIFVSSSSRIRSYQGSSSQGADNTFTGTLSSSLYLSSGTLRYYHSAGSGHAPIGATSNVTVLNATANACGSTLCGVQGGGGGGSGLGPKGAPALAQYREMAEEYAAIVETCHGASPQTDATDPQYETDNDTLTVRLSDLSSQMGDLARTEIRNILGDSVPDMVLLKQWYATIVETCHGASLQDSTIPVSAYQLAEVYSQEGDLSTARTLLAALPQQFIPDEAVRSEYSNYMALQQLRETVDGNWYLMTDTDIAAMQQVAENGGRAARMAKEILCFFHHICYEDDMALNLGDIGERNLSGGRTDDGRTRCVPTDNGLVIYPNPTGGTLTVESASPIREITVYDLSGRVMMTANGGIVETCHGASLQMDVSSLQGGIYLLRVVTTSGVETGRFVKD